MHPPAGVPESYQNYLASNTHIYPYTLAEFTKKEEIESRVSLPVQIFNSSCKFLEENTPSCVSKIITETKYTIILFDVHFPNYKVALGASAIGITAAALSVFFCPESLQ
jgi:hypothetical protein